MRNTIWTILLLASTHAAAQLDRLYLDDATADVGESVDVGVYIQDVGGTVVDTVIGGFDGFFGAGMELNFDPALVESIEFVQTGLSQTSAPFLFIDGSEVSNGLARFLCVYGTTPMPLVVDDPPELFCVLRITPSAQAAGQVIDFSFVDQETFLDGNSGFIILRDSLGNLDLSIGSVTVNGSGGTPPTIASFSAAPASIEQGGSSTLSWTVNDADTVTISDGVGSVASTGSTSVSPTETTTYTLTATNEFGTRTSQATVTVAAPGQPRIESFAASPGQIVSGGNATLSWATADADSVTIEPDVGAVATSGSVQISPTRSTTYTLTATNVGGSVTAQATIDIVGVTEILTFTASPSMVEAGSSSTLSWTTDGASQVTLDGKTVNTNGSMTVSPTQTTTYQLVATGPLSQRDTASVTVQVTGDTALALDQEDAAFGANTEEIVLALSVNSFGVYPWSLENLPHWLNADISSGNVDSERPTQITLTVDRTRLFPGQTLQAEIAFSSAGLVGVALPVSVTREEKDDELYLYYPLIEANNENRGEITVVNLADGNADMWLLLYLPDGTLLGDPVKSTLPARASYRLSPNVSLIDGSAWAVATLKPLDASVTPAGTGCVNVRSTDGERLYGLSAEAEKADFLNVPHIAQDTETFFTRSAVVNLANDTRTSMVVLDNEFPIANQDSAGQEFFDYGNVLGASIADAEWGQIAFDDNTDQASIGAEVFGFNQVARTVGVGLSQRTFTELFFTHIAADLDNFWTGVVVINTENRRVDVRFDPYNSNFELIDGGFVNSLGPGEKRTYVVLGERLDFGQDAAWVRVSSSAEITGYELFSNPGGSGADTFAGLEAIGALSKRLAFPHTEEAVSENGVTAVVVINPGTTTAEVTFTLISSDGDVKATSTVPALRPKQKLTNVASAIFDGAQISFGDIILVDSDQDIAGFELYGDLIGTMGALNAAPYQ